MIIEFCMIFIQCAEVVDGVRVVVVMRPAIVPRTSFFDTKIGFPGNGVRFGARVISNGITISIGMLYFDCSVIIRLSRSFARPESGDLAGC